MSNEEAHRQLEKIIDAVAASYDAGRRIDNLESAALPNQRQVIEALRHLQHVLYMGFYSTRPLNRVNLRQAVGEHLYSAFEILCQQISRAVVYARVGHGAPSPQDVEWSERAILDVFAKLPEIRETVALDVEAAYQGDPAAKSIEEVIFSYPAVEAISIYRIAHEFHLRDVPLIPRIMSEYAHGRTGIDIHPGAQIGKHFFIDHGTGVVIGETTVIGDRVKIYQGVTLGALSLPRDATGELIRGRKRHPTIEDDVTIYAGATILGGETVVGAGSVIGGNVWLTESVPPGSRVTYSVTGATQRTTVRGRVKPERSSQ
ncbi:MAG: serine acetyltransferase [Candidatus Dadabacteria bacterium]|nr:MAG: serine acetyltransferase [Candidatus Dadabacteria bacterium]